MDGYRSIVNLEVHLAATVLGSPYAGVSNRCFEISGALGVVFADRFLTKRCFSSRLVVVIWDTALLKPDVKKPLFKRHDRPPIVAGTSTRFVPEVRVPRSCCVPEVPRSCSATTQVLARFRKNPSLKTRLTAWRPSARFGWA